MRWDSHVLELSDKESHHKIPDAFVFVCNVYRSPTAVRSCSLAALIEIGWSSRLHDDVMTDEGVKNFDFKLIRGGAGRSPLLYE
jgi:hypothetical protein